jgi:hypothetical protein
MQKRWSPRSMSSPAWAVRSRTLFVGAAPALLRVVHLRSEVGERVFCRSPRCERKLLWARLRIG